MIDKDLLAILACPACHSDVAEEGDKIICLDPACALRYPVREGIPVLLVDEAIKPGSDQSRTVQ